MIYDGTENDGDSIQDKDRVRHDGKEAGASVECNEASAPQEV